MAVLWLVILALAAGFLVVRLMKYGSDVPMIIILGCVGGLVGGLTLSAIAAIASSLAGLVGAILGATLLIWLWKNKIFG